MYTDSEYLEKIEKGGNFTSNEINDTKNGDEKLFFCPFFIKFSFRKLCVLARKY